MFFSYYGIVFMLLMLLFIVLFCDSLLYQKSSTCNDMDDETEYTVCFDVNNDYNKIDCINKDTSTDLEVICYTTDFSPFRALGVSFGAVSAVRLAVSVVSFVGIKMVKYQPGRCLFITLQVICGLASFLCPTIFYSLFYTHVQYVPNILIYGNPPLIHCAVWLVALLLVVLFWGFPWCAFIENREYREEIVTLQDRKYRTIVENTNQRSGSQPFGNQPTVHILAGETHPYHRVPDQSCPYIA